MGSGREALELVQQGFSADLVLTDQEMPGMAGIELVEALRAHPAYASTPIFVVTTLARQTDREGARRVGVNGWLVKPLKLERVKALLRRLDWETMNEAATDPDHEVEGWPALLGYEVPDGSTLEEKLELRLQNAQFLVEQVQAIQANMALFANSERPISRRASPSNPNEHGALRKLPRRTRSNPRRRSSPSRLPR